MQHSDSNSSLWIDGFLLDFGELLGITCWSSLVSRQYLVAGTRACFVRVCESKPCSAGDVLLIFVLWVCRGVALAVRILPKRVYLALILF